MEVVSKDKVYHDLIDMGIFNKWESKVYLDLAVHGQSTINEICKRTKGYRANVSASIQSLIQKGFVMNYIKDSKKLLIAKDPIKFAEYFNQKKIESEILIEQIKRFKRESYHDESASISKGVFAYRAAMLEMLELNRPINSYGIPLNAVSILGEAFMSNFHRKRIQKKIFMRHIYNKDASDRIDELLKMKYVDVKHLSSKYDSSVTTNICGDQVFFGIFWPSISVISIKSQEIADAYNRYFEILWKNASL